MKHFSDSPAFIEYRTSLLVMINEALSNLGPSYYIDSLVSLCVLHFLQQYWEAYSFSNKPRSSAPMLFPYPRTLPVSTW